MRSLNDELSQQPQVLRDLAAYYAADFSRLQLPVSLDEARMIVFTGMGASYHAAAIGSLYFNSLGIPAAAVEATDLGNYPSALLGKSNCVIYISQSGSSGEIHPLLGRLGKDTTLLGITNTPDSLLGKNAAKVFSQMAGVEDLIASKTYINSVALIWLMGQKLAGMDMQAAVKAVNEAADLAEKIIAYGKAAAQRLVNFYQTVKPLLFTGHGPHALTARQASMTSSEWAKIASLHAGVGAFRHGFIETVLPGFGAILFTAPGLTQESTLKLAVDLVGIGAKVLRIENGQVLEWNEPSPVSNIDEFLSPVLDILPVQLFTGNLASTLEIPFGFRYISKVVREL